MTSQEFSNTFDTLIASYIGDNSFGTVGPLQFDEYEKSVFLTKAQEQIIISLYNGKNPNGDSFESSEEMRRYLEPLVVQRDKSDAYTTVNLLSDKSYAYKLEANVMFIVFESVDFNPKNMGCKPYQGIQVVPITHDEYHKIKNNPFRGPTDNRVLRLDAHLSSGNQPYVELISNHPITNYRYRYIRKPNPIILQDLGDNLSINGISTERTSELNKALHDKILELAVQLALQSRSINNNNS